MEKELNVSKQEIGQALRDIENMDVRNIGVFSLLAWIETAVDILQRINEEPQRPLFD